MLMRGRTLIRKTSLLRKIEPIARRSSFANRIIYNSLISSMNERRNDLEIVIGKKRIASRDPKLGSISSLRCQKSRRRVPKDSACEVMFRGRYSLPASQPVFSLSSFDAAAFATIGLAEP